MNRLIKVAVIGARGRMGRATCDAVNSAADLALVARVEVGDDIRAKIRESGAEVAIDFTTPAQAEANVRTILEAGAHAVCGTTGWTPDALQRIADQLDTLNSARRLTAPGRPSRGVVVVPNFAISAVLAMHLAQVAAKYFESAEVIELHHPGKVDAPSGTARHTAELIGAAREAAGLPNMPDATETGFEARGAKVAGVPVHAVRLRGLVAHQEVLLGNPGEQLVIRQDSFDRVSFMPGVLLAVREVVNRPGLTLGLEPLLDL